MAENQLIYKVVPTIIENNVEFNLQNSQYEQSFGTKKTLFDEITSTSGPASNGIVPLPGFNDTFASSPGAVNPLFIELIADAPINFRFIALTASGTFLTNIGPTTYVAGNIRGHNFDVEHIGSEPINIQWSFYQDD